ncbi:SLBB domain-containing protein [Synechococcus sp. RS9916]|uniref:polysaccharide biosynthesis/export family protein n=1 Tax=Synechococcus sp. RS9916 TaxID=221359 RepID=UPI0002D7A655|nr:SLBB domain-containing protein [Synechococcus sp. RS9916]
MLGLSVQSLVNFKFLLFFQILSIILFPLASNANEIDYQKETTEHKSISQKSLHSNYYILGPGDSVFIELINIPEFSGVYSIGPDGTLYLPRLRSLYVEGLTVEELRYFLFSQYASFIKDPDIFVSPAAYRPVRVYVGGEVARPGYYYLSTTNTVISEDYASRRDALNLNSNIKMQSEIVQQFNNLSNNGQQNPSSNRLPRLFDALQVAGGVTPFSNLEEVTVTRKRPLSEGGGSMRAKVNFLSLITNGDESGNLRLVDGDTVFVTRSTTELRDQIIKASQTNLSPSFIQVYITGRVRDPGMKILPQGASLDQALAAAGGQKLLRGQVEFVRFNRNGSTDKRNFFSDGSNSAGSFTNPILMSGDVIRVNQSPLSATLDVLNEVTGPAVGVYSIYNLFR